MTDTDRPLRPYGMTADLEPMDREAEKLHEQSKAFESALTLNDVDEWLKLNNLPTLHISYRASTWTVILSSSTHVSYTTISPQLAVAWEAAKQSYETQSKGESALHHKMDAALKAKDAKQLGTLVETMRMQGWRYMDIVRYAQACSPSLSLAEWETLMQEADEEG